MYNIGISTKYSEKSPTVTVTGLVGCILTLMRSLTDGLFLLYLEYIQYIKAGSFLGYCNAS